MDQDTQPLFGLSIEGQTTLTVNSSATWARVLSICGIIFGAMMIFLGIVFTSIISGNASKEGFESDSIDKNMAFAAGMGMFVYIIMGALTILGNVFLLNYANRISAAVKSNDSVKLNSAFTSLRNYCAFWAIIMIISLLLFSLGLLAQLTAG